MPTPDPSQLLPDKVQRAALDGSVDVWIDSAFEKDGWAARRAEDFTRAEHPGTAIDLDGRLYEVFSIEPSSEPGYAVRYGLKAWDASHTIRRVIPYTPETRAQAAAEFLSESRRQRLRQRITWFFPLAGLVPDALQQRWEEETVLPMAVASAASCLLEITIFAALVHAFGRSPSSRALVWFMDYFGVDGFLRLVLVVTMGKPRGLFLFSAPYLLWQAATRTEKKAVAGTEADALDEPDEVIRHPASGHLTIRSILLDRALAGPEPIRFEGAFYSPLAWSLQGRGLRRRWLYEFQRIEAEAPKRFREFSRPRPPAQQQAARDLTRRFDRAQAMALVWGLYPASAQTRLETLYRFPSVQMTKATAGLLLAAGLLECWVGWMRDWPVWAYVVPAYFVLESVCRLAYAAARSDVRGSLAGFLLRPFLRSLEP